MVMQNSVLDPQDQRKTSKMEDSSAITVEFLRARLLSERSISRSARQRADELAKKVIELEEQLRMVTLQRKMAEKAAADVLAILENQGISDVSGEFDSGSYHEITCDSSVCNDSAKDSERSIGSKVRRHGSDDLSGSQVNYSPPPGRSLPWKGRLDSSQLLEKYKNSSVRRRSSFSSISYSPRHRLGKSCRRIKRREIRSEVDDPKVRAVNVISQENEVVSSFEGFPNGSNGGPNILGVESKIQEEDGSVLKLADKDHDVDGYEREYMEKALQHQAKLIDQYEAMEKAQREWEEKFQENNTTTPDSFDIGNHSDITEERDENNAKIPYSARETNSSAQQDRLEARVDNLSEEIINAEPEHNKSKSYDDTGNNNQINATVSTSGLVEEISHSQLKGNKNECQENCHSLPLDRRHQGPCKHDFPNTKPTDTSPLPDSQNNAPRDKNGHSELGFHELSSVLESLKQAKLSLLEKMNKLPLLESGYTGKANPLAPSGKSEDRYDIPFGCSGLFRVPTYFSDEEIARFNAHDSTSGLGSKFYLSTGISRTSVGRVGTNPYYDTMFSAENQSLATRYSETLSRCDTKRVPSGKHMYRTHPSTSYPNPTQQISLGEGLSRPYSSSLVGVHPAYIFSFHSDHGRSNMHI